MQEEEKAEEAQERRRAKVDWTCPGSALATSGTAVGAAVNSEIAASVALFLWLIIDWIHRGRPGIWSILERNKSIDEQWDRFSRKYGHTLDYRFL